MDATELSHGYCRHIENVLKVCLCSTFCRFQYWALAFAHSSPAQRFLSLQKSDLHTAFVSISLQGLCDSAPHLGYLSNICPQLLTPVSVHSALASSASITHPVIIGCRTQPSLTSIPSPALFTHPVIIVVGRNPASGANLAPFEMRKVSQHTYTASCVRTKCASFI
jgi:hypothetical protein